MKYRDVLNLLQTATEEELDQDATIQIGLDEFVPLEVVGVAMEGSCTDGILDDGHLYLVPAVDFTAEHGCDDMKVVEVLRSGELLIDPGNTTIGGILAQCGRRLDKACAGDIQGEVLFRADNDKWYTVNTESLVEQASQGFINAVKEEMLSEREESRRHG